MPVIPRRALTWPPFPAALAQPPKGVITGAVGRPTERKTTFLPVPSLMVGLPPSRSHPGAADNGPIGVAGAPGRTRLVAESPLFAAGGRSAANGGQSITLSITRTALPLHQRG